jgi:hypothetical protein
VTSRCSEARVAAADQAARAEALRVIERWHRALPERRYPPFTTDGLVVVSVLS